MGILAACVTIREGALYNLRLVEGNVTAVVTVWDYSYYVAACGYNAVHLPKNT
jgi:hypothetical protein